MNMTKIVLNLLLTSVVALFMVSHVAHGDVFDRYTNHVLGQAIGQPGVIELTLLTAEQANEAPKLVPGSNSALILVRTSNGFNAKLLVQFARQKFADRVFPVLVIERFVTYRPGTERSIAAEGRNIHLYPGYVFHLEIGQIVPGEIGGDLRFDIDPKKGEVLQSLGKARLYLITRSLAGTEIKKSARPAPDDPYRPEFFNGSFRLYDDGRRSGLLRLQVDAEGNLSGEFLSDATGNKYPVSGKVGPNPRHLVQFTIKFPQSVQHFSGYIFTRGGAAICGTSKFQERDAGFYAIRVDED
jgi:hypothetical protein